MSFQYTRANLKSRINAGIHGKIGMLISAEDLMNEVVRQVNTDIHLRSARRKASLSPMLFSDVFDFTAPSDLQADRIIDIPAQAKREGQEFFLTTPEEFDRKKENANGLIALDTFNGTRRLKIALKVDDKTKVISELDSTTSGGGTWSGFGDGSNLTADSDNFLKGSASINWDIDASAGTTAGIQNSTLNSFDLDDDYLGGNGAGFVHAYFNNVTNLTNMILQLGSSAAAYHSKTITTAHDGTAFVAGWNLLRWDLTSLTPTGSPDNDAIKHAAMYMTKDAAKVSETDYRFDYLVLRKGVIHEVKYYTKYGWQTSAEAYQENSSDDADLIVAETDEFNIIVRKGIEVAAEEVNEYDISAKAGLKYEKMIKEYKMANPSEAKIMSTEYYAY